LVLRGSREESGEKWKKEGRYSLTYIKLVVETLETGITGKALSRPERKF